jgi:hypothetical protein
MRTVLKIVFAMTLLFSLSAAYARDTDFETNQKNAERLSTTPLGVQYDKTIGTYLMGLPDTEKGMSKCLNDNPGPQRVKGFFKFETTGTYSLELRPNNSFAKCIKNVLEGRNPPPPPELPYFSPFEFEYDGT